MVEQVTPIYNLKPWQMPRIVPADVLRILEKWNLNYQQSNALAIAHEIAGVLNDKLDTPEGGQVLYFAYSHSYTDLQALDSMFGDRIVTIDEMRSADGFLRQYRVVLNPAKDQSES